MTSTATIFRPVQRKYTRKHDIAGQVFGELTAIEPIAAVGQRTGMWRCRCSCGQETAQASTALVRGRIVSCGCKQREANAKARQKEPGHAGKRNLYCQYKAGAAARGHTFDLTFGQLIAIVVQPRAYCDAPPSRVITGSGKGSAAAKERGKFVCNGIDRVNNGVGYTEANCVPCCSICNFAKQELTQEAFIQWIARAHKHLFGVG